MQEGGADMKLEVCQLGKVSYPEALTIQEQLLSLRQAGKIGDLLLLLEHPPVITLGKKGKTNNILVPPEWLDKNQITVHSVNRGGDVTYHGPGQIVGYPFIDLANHGKDIRKFIRNIEQVFISLLHNYYQINAFRDPDHTGVWLEQGKITAIGFAIKRWVTMHGFAFNVNTDLSHYQWIVPCGITDKAVSSLQSLLGYELDLEIVNKQLVATFADVFNYEVEKISADQIQKYLGSIENGTA